MKAFNKAILVFAFVCMGLFSQTIYANDTIATGSNLNVVVEKSEDEKTVNLTSEDSSIRITLDAKKYYDLCTFEAQLNLEGGAKEGTNITIKVNNISKDKNRLVLGTKEYKVATVGSTASFNQLIELFDGQNEINLTYTHEKDKKIQGNMIFVIEKFTESDKNKILELPKPGTGALNNSK